ncbi:hypothetical protein [Microbacterium kyungheense]|uniref:Uncharacterized protein n=1 Tax=Microbacterium kyungheense TaxID=1263636 RepID=A0A543EEY2_9MICO|nr:hypothetical protein [Microbacterium kyungheense]TQM20145.1 hypothetical protein FB391_3279 [Microbacterium kyungheense]
MTSRKQRPVIAVIGGVLFWLAAAATFLFGIAAVWLLVNGQQPAWIIFAVTVPLGALAVWLIKISRVPFGDALNVGF